MGKAHGGGRSVTWAEGTWHDGNPKVLGPRNHAVWLSSVVFDGARAFEGVVPDLDRHCARLNRSAEILGMKGSHSGPEIEALAREGIARFDADAELYVCPMYYAEEGFIVPEPDSTRLVVTVYESPLPPPTGFTACRSSFRRPARDMAPTEAKASCLYPNVGRAQREAGAKGFDTAVILDGCGNVAEFGFTNLFMVQDGAVHTPAINGTFLNGITRQRVIQLLREEGREVVERAIGFDELFDADELFATGNYAKVAPCVRLEDKEFEPGPTYHAARDLYMAFARGV